MLKAVHALQSAERAKAVFHAVFITHSEATRRAILNFLTAIDINRYFQRDRSMSEQSLLVCTLSRLCASQLRQQISESEFIDRDALESKELQRLYIADALEDVLAKDYPSHRRFMSGPLISLIDSVSAWKVAEMIQHEISVLIKGRAGENLDVYKKIPKLRYGLPIDTEGDKGLVFTIFRKYQDLLGKAAQFDTDDVVLSAIGQLDTPIWRRRRVRDGYDAIFIDETHLFNINELHIFHHFTRSASKHPIIYSIDKTQAVGDHGWTRNDISSALVEESNLSIRTSESKLNTVFRCSPDIVKLAFSIVSSGATLFTNFDNPMDAAVSGFTVTDEKLASEPQYIEYPNDGAMVEGAFERQNSLSHELGCSRSDILLVVLDHGLLKELERHAVNRNKQHAILKRRGDVNTVESSRITGSSIIAHADYVGGLEFLAVVLIGIDGGRVPPETAGRAQDSKNFQAYSSHNRLYVAVSRAKYRVEILGERSRGHSQLLSSAIEEKSLTVVDAETL